MHDMIDSASYMAHGYCLLWKPWLVTLHALSDFLIFGAYFAIPVAIWIFVRRRPNVELRGLAILFAAFILLCGFTHIINLVTLWWPIYEFQGVLKAVTAAVSVVTAVMIFPLIPKALAIPSPNELMIANSELAAEVAAHKHTLSELKSAKLELEARVDARTKDLGEATERFRSLFENAPVAMLMADDEGTVRQANSAAEELFAQAKGDLVGSNVDILLPEARREPHRGLREEFDKTPAAQPMGFGRELYGRQKNGSEIPVQIGLNPVSVQGKTFVVASIIDISARRKAEQRMQIVMRELSHRSKNLLALVQAMLRQTIASVHDMPTLEKDFGERLQCLARSHELLVASEWQGASIDHLIRSQLAFLGGTRDTVVIADGPPVVLSPAAIQNIGLALHELATNAIKHGALSRSGGRVAITWDITTSSDDEPVFRMAWTESGVPLSNAPARRGFGLVLLETVVPQSLGGTASFTFASDGVAWEVNAPLEYVISIAVADENFSRRAQATG